MRLMINVEVIFGELHQKLCSECSNKDSILKKFIKNNQNLKIFTT